MQLRVIETLDPEPPVLSIDGIALRGPNLSHRVGNRTPEHLRADTVAAMVAELIARPEEYLALRRDHPVVAVGDYSAGAALAVFLLLEPDLSLTSLQLLLEAATAADYHCLNSDNGVRVALILDGLRRAPPAELTEAMAVASGRGEQIATLFAYALQLLPTVLVEPQRFPAYWHEELNRTHRWLNEFRQGRHQILARDADLDLIHVLSRGWFDHRALRTIAPESRTLVSIEQGGGFSHVFTYEVESFYDMETIEAPERHDPAPWAEELSGLDGASWRADPDLDAPLVRMRSASTPSRITPDALWQRLATLLEKADGLDVDWPEPPA